MNSKEKALELVDKYRNTIMSFLNDNMKDMNAKKCALITVDEISEHCYEVMKPFWEEVKQEIELL